VPRDCLTVADVLGMHTVLMKRYGGALGVRDPGALEAALFRPQTGYYQDIVAEAAALIESLAINHPFVDGNKRIAFAAADVFLRINGWRLQRAARLIHADMMQMFDHGTFDIAHLDPWLRGFAKAEEGSDSLVTATTEPRWSLPR
jgi:death on curing protein